MKVNQVIDHIVGWLNRQCESAGLHGFTVGVSGGIDSALTSTLCAKTGRTVIPLIMPILQDPNQVPLATRHIDWLEERFENVQGETVDLTPAFLALEKSLPSDIQDDLTMANTRSRLRMVTLYAVASHHRLLVAGTGNKVEDFGVGFFTKYGDGGVDVSPIADLMKSDVYRLAKALDVIEPILSAAPVDGLWADNRTDESQIGASYDELEWAMRFIDDPSFSPEPSPRQREVIEIYRRFHRKNKHKMEPIPTCTIPAELK